MTMKDLEEKREDEKTFGQSEEGLKKQNRTAQIRRAINALEKELSINGVVTGPIMLKGRIYNNGYFIDLEE